MTKRAEIERLLRLERPDKEIARRVGTTQTYVRVVRLRLGIKLPQRKLSEAPRAEYMRQYYYRTIALLTDEERSAIRGRAYREARDRGLSPEAANTAAAIAVVKACRRRRRYLAARKDGESVALAPAAKADRGL